ncbi:MAG: hypothetical protein P0Y49_05125 [Candidatus Pedobacter colombiensis]|uniref:Uncharacterized protein n=1 Tax=Candidatus Pedobacter colombiensis TaxID=3121371 RepID=A0AAJ5WAR2_9SPHI|nr:hypothetical protein [Pedobacter sp.]WEK20518.1 MAG: hypothetical protein P0Y49_05125 [Pedobacter sp.]
MKTFNLKMPARIPVIRNIERYVMVSIVLLLWSAAPHIFVLPQGNSEEIATSIGLMVLLALMCLLLMLGLCWWLLQRFWVSIGLPSLDNMVLQFQKLQLWEQLKFALCLFALFLFAGVGMLIAVL